MSPRLDTMIISRYGWDILVPFAIFLVFVLLFIGFTFFTLILSALFLFLVYMHRNPERISNYSQEGSILSPIDGRVKTIISIEQSPIDGKPGFEVIIESAYIDTAVLRSPIDSKMSIDKLRRGAMLPLHSGYENLNETADIRFSSKVGDILVRHLLGSWARPLGFGIEGKVLQGQRYGFMLNGTSCVYLPSNSRVAVKEGMFLSAGESVIGFFSETV
ncbi:MAG: hypothetical protein COA44_08140 [Arcobacter sp.]|nr:MAG: hypothetical protein COA44_08140 [Arcobacter sp.]